MFPVCRKLQTMHGPYSSCLMTAESYWRCFPDRHSKQLRILFTRNCRSQLFSNHSGSIIYLATYLFTAALFFIFALCSAVMYIVVRLFLRFQLKLALSLIMMQRAPFEFKWLNKLLLMCLHLCLFLIGGFGYWALSFVDT